MVKNQVKEPLFDPWHGSVFTIVQHPRDDFAGVKTQVSPRRSRSRIEYTAHLKQDNYDDVRTDSPTDFLEYEDVKPIYISSTSTQSKNKKTDPNYRPGELEHVYGGYVSARPASGRGTFVGNSYYQRLSGRMGPEPQVSRRPEPNIPYVHMDSMQNRKATRNSTPIFRAGRAGAPWRHVTQCLGNLGNHICFIDGSVKQNDLKRFPPYGYVHPSDSYSYNAAPVARRLGTAPAIHGDGVQYHHGSKYSGVFNSHAKKGFKYWQEEKQVGGRPISGLSLWAGGTPKQTIQGRMMKLGIGY